MTKIWFQPVKQDIPCSENFSSSQSLHAMLSLTACCGLQGLIFLPISGGPHHFWHRWDIAGALSHSWRGSEVTSFPCSCCSKRQSQFWEQKDGHGTGSWQIPFVKSKWNGYINIWWFGNKNYWKFSWVSTCLPKGIFLSMSLFIFCLPRPSN